MKKLTLTLFLLFLSVPALGEGLKKEIDELGYSVKNPKLKAKVSNLFSHAAHADFFKELSLKCIDCHNFSIKNDQNDPLAPPVKMRVLRPSKKVCHDCHLGQVSVPRRKQCNLCHTDIDELKPRDHSLNWKTRHGIRAELDADSCKQCHQQNECTTCHSQRDNMKLKVHRGNFKYFHSIEARAKPQACITCHHSANFCNDCHSGKRQ